MAGALAELFSSKVRAAVLGHLLPRPRQAFGLTDLSRALGLPVSSLQHECYKLERVGVLAAARDGSVRRYSPDPSFPLLPPYLVCCSTSVRRPHRITYWSGQCPTSTVCSSSSPPGSCFRP